MKHCGNNQWWIDGAKLVIRRQRRSVDILKGLGALALSAALAWLYLRKPELELRGVFYVLLGAGYGISSALGAWEVTLNRGTGRGSWRWGLGVPFFSWNKKVVANTDRVQLVTSQGTSSDWRTNACSVQLTGEDLASSDNYDEALELAEAVAGHMRLGLQIDNGRVQAGSAEPLSSPAPPGCRVQVREVGEQRVVELPAPGWVVSSRLQAGGCCVLMLAPVGLAGYLHLRHHVSWQTLAMLSPLLLLLTAPIGLFLHGIWEGVHSSWHITVSPWGLELKSVGPRAEPATRWGTRLIRDIDVREQIGGTMRVSNATRPMLVIERHDGTTVAIGEGLPREELEWAASRIRQELAAPGEHRQQKRNAG
jgi:hypothetical protein